MNKNVSLAIEKAVGSISEKNHNELKNNNGPKKPDLFSLSGETELFQNEKGITIKIDRSRDSNLTYFFSYGSQVTPITSNSSPSSG